MKKLFLFFFVIVDLSAALMVRAQFVVEPEYQSEGTNRAKCGFTESDTFHTNCCPPLNRYFKQYLLHVQWNCNHGFLDGNNDFQADWAGTAEYDTTETCDPSNSCAMTCVQSGSYHISGNYNIEGTSTNCGQWTVKNSADGTDVWGGMTSGIDNDYGFESSWDFDGYMSWGGTGGYVHVPWWSWDSINVTFQCGDSPERDEVDKQNPYGYYGSATHTYNQTLSSEYTTLELMTPFGGSYDPGWVPGIGSASAYISGDQSSLSMSGARLRFHFESSPAGNFLLPYVIHIQAGPVDLYETNVIPCFGSGGRSQYYPAGDGIQLHPPFARISGSCSDFYYGGSESVSLLNTLCMLNDNGDLTGRDSVQCGTCSCGMPTWQVSEPYINLWVADKPVEYTTSLGEKIAFAVHYKQHDMRPSSINGQAPFLPVNGWNNNWYSYVHFMGETITNEDGSLRGQSFTNWTATLYEPDGGATVFSSAQAINARTGDQLLPMDGINAHVYPQASGILGGGSNVYGVVGFRRVHPDGSQDIYGMVSPLYPIHYDAVIPVVLDPTDVNSTPIWSPDGFHHASHPVLKAYAPVIIGTFSSATNDGWMMVPDGNTNSFTESGNPVVDYVVTNKNVTMTADPSADALLTEHIDPNGNSIHLNYTDSGGQYYLESIVDYDGKVTVISYDTNGYISSVNMPYGRTASFQYAANTNAQLLSITDAQNMTSSFSYGTDGLMSQMHTPYGTTSFDSFETNADSVVKMNEGVTRAVRITNPDGSHEMYAFFNKETNSAPANYEPDEVPASLNGVGSASDTGANATDDQGRMYMRNSFYWGRKQCAALSATSVASLNSLSPADFLAGRMTHWMLADDGITVSSAASMIRESSPDGTTSGQKTWYYYPNRANDWQLYGDAQNPAALFRLMPDGATWYQQMYYDQYGQMNYIGSAYADPYGYGDIFTRYISCQFDITTYSQDCSLGGNGLGTNTWFASKLTSINGLGINQYIYDSYSHDQLTVSETRTGTDGNAYTFNSTYPHWSSMLVGDGVSLRTLFFNDRSQLTGIIGPAGLTTTNLYDAGGFLAKTISFETQATNAYTFANGLLATKVNPLGLTTRYSWDNLERLTGVAYPDNTTISNVYTLLDLTGQKDRLNQWSYAQYDNMRRMTLFTDRNGNATALGYCACGALETITDPQTNTTTYNRDLNGRVSSIIFSDAAGHQTTRTFTRDLLGRATQVADSSGLNLYYGYNIQGLVTNISSSMGTVFAATYDSVDQPLTIQNAEGISVTNNYDFFERPLDRYFAAGLSQHFHYNGWLMDYAVDGLGHVTYYGYDTAERLTSTMDANYNTNGFTYNPLGQIATLADGNGHVTTWTYDLYGRKITKKDGNNVLVETNGYDANGRLTAHWTPAKGLTHYTYDANGNRLTTTYSSGPGITATYDSLNRLLSLSDAVGASAFTYQDFGAFQGALATEDGPWASDTVTRSYANWLLHSLSLAQPSGSWGQIYAYDGLQRLHALASSAGTFTYTYNGAGRQVQSVALPGGNSVANTYDAAGQLLSTALKQGSTVLDAYAYVYDLNGNRTSVTRADDSQVAYGYDGIGQLTSAVGVEPDGETVRGNEDFDYGYDGAGNLATRRNHTLAQTFATDNANELVNVLRNEVLTVAGSLTNHPSQLQINGQAAAIYNDLTFAVTNGVALNDGLNLFTAVITSGVTMTNVFQQRLPASVNLAYDLNGNLTSDGLHGYEYDCANELARVTVTNQWQTEFVYDGLGRKRIKKEYSWSGAGWTETDEVHYVYDGMTVIQERDGSNNPQVSYTRGTDLSGTMQGAGGIGGLLARTDASGSAFYHADRNGNITMLINASGTALAKYLYDSFGNLLAKSGALADANKYRFSSMEYEELGGLVGYWGRFYDPNLQRWLNQDPLGEAGGINLYQYVRNNPLRFIDPDGKAPQLIGVSYDLGTGQSSSQYQNQQFGQGYGIGLHNPPSYPSPFLFGGGEAHLPFHQGAWESATFVGHDKEHGWYAGGLHCPLTNKKGGFFVAGAGKEGGFSSKEGAYNVDVGITEIDLGVGGVGYIWDNNGEEGIFLYIETPASSKIGGGFVGGGISF